MDISGFLSTGDVINLVLVDRAYPFDRGLGEDDQAPSRLQGRVGFVDDVGLYVHSNGGRCTASFDEDAAEIDGSELTGIGGTFFPWRSVISLTKVMDSDRYNADWRKNDRDAEAYYHANGAYPESNSEFFQWRNSLSQAGYDAAYNASNGD